MGGILADLCRAVAHGGGRAEAVAAVQLMGEMRHRGLSPQASSPLCSSAASSLGSRARQPSSGPGLPRSQGATLGTRRGGDPSSPWRPQPRAPGPLGPGPFPAPLGSGAVGAEA